MNDATVTEICNIRIWKTTSLGCHARVGGRVVIVPVAFPWKPDITPGSARLSDSETDGIHTKKLTFSIPDTSEETSEILRGLTACDIVAVYGDHRRKSRAFASPTWPASLTWTRGGASTEVTVTAKSDGPDPLAYFATEC